MHDLLTPVERSACSNVNPLQSLVLSIHAVLNLPFLVDLWLRSFNNILFQTRTPFPYDVPKVRQLSLFDCRRKFFVGSWYQLSLAPILWFSVSRSLSKSITDLLFQRHEVDLHLNSSKSSSHSHKMINGQTTVFGRPYYRSCLWYTVSSVVCLSSVTFCIVAKWYVLARNCLKE